MDTITEIDLSVPSSPSLVMHDLADYATLPFLAAFDIQSHQKNPQAPSAQKRVTYIALTKKTMPILVNLFLRFKENEEIYVDGTLESILSVCSFTGHLLGRRIIDGDTYRHTPYLLSSSMIVRPLQDSAKIFLCGKPLRRVFFELSKSVRTRYIF